MNDETKQKISNAIRKRWAEREKYGLYGHKMSTEQKVKLSKSIKNKWDNHEYDHLKECELSDDLKTKISISVKKKWTDETYANKNRQSLVEYWDDINKRQHYSNLAQERWQNQSYKEITLVGIRRITSDPLYKEIMRQHGIRRASEISKLFKLLWQDPIFRERHKIVHSLAMQDPIVRQKLSDCSRKSWSNNEFRLKCVEHLRQQCYNPKRIEALLAVMNTVAYRERIQKSVKLAFQSTELRERLRQSSILTWQKPKYRERMAKIRLSQPRTSFQQEILYSILRDLKIDFHDDKSEKCLVGWYVFDCRINPQPDIRILKPILIEVQGD